MQGCGRFVSCGRGYDSSIAQVYVPPNILESIFRRASCVPLRHPQSSSIFPEQGFHLPLIASFCGNLSYLTTQSVHIKSFFARSINYICSYIWLTYIAVEQYNYVYHYYFFALKRYPKFHALLQLYGQILFFISAYSKVSLMFINFKDYTVHGSWYLRCWVLVWSTLRDHSELFRHSIELQPLKQFSCTIHTHWLFMRFLETPYFALHCQQYSQI